MVASGGFVWPPTPPTRLAAPARVGAALRALTEMEAAGLTAGVEFELVAGPDHYLLGEETGLLQVIEGEEPLPVLPLS